MSEATKRDELVRGCEHLWLSDLRKNPGGEVRLVSSEGKLISGTYAFQVTRSVDAMVRAATEPRSIETVEELDALPDGALVMLSGERALGGRSIFETRRASLFRDPIPLTEPPRWGLVSMQDDAGIPARDLLHLPGELTLIFEPTTEAAR